MGTWAMPFGAVLLVISLAVGQARAATPLPLSGFHQMVVDEANHHVFLTGTPTANDSIVVLDFDGNIVTTIPGLPGASGLVLDPRRHKHVLYVALNTADAIAAVSTIYLTELGRTQLGPSAECPDSLAFVRSRLWFGFGCPDGGIGSMNTHGGDMKTYTDFSQFPFYEPILASTPHLSDVLFASERGLSPATIFRYSITHRGGVPTLTTSVFDPGQAENLADMVVLPDGSDVLTASGYPYYLNAFRASDVTQDGTYPTGPYPIAVATTADSMFVAAGILGIYSPDVFVFPVRSTTPVHIYDLAMPPSNGPYLADRGLAFDGSGDRLFVVTQKDIVSDVVAFDVIPNPTNP